jgi:hypothetical protein
VANHRIGIFVQVVAVYQAPAHKRVVAVRVSSTEPIEQAFDTNASTAKRGKTGNGLRLQLVSPNLCLYNEHVDETELVAPNDH